jgi:hypothetical protein
MHPAEIKGDDMEQRKDSPGCCQLEGRYANYFKVGHNAFDFVFEFGQFYSDNSSPRLHTRIITNPAHAKTLLQLLQESVEKYERVFGAIATDELI